MSLKAVRRKKKCPICKSIKESKAFYNEKASYCIECVRVYNKKMREKRQMYNLLLAFHVDKNLVEVIEQEAKSLGLKRAQFLKRVIYYFFDMDHILIDDFGNMPKCTEEFEKYFDNTIDFLAK